MGLMIKIQSGLRFGLNFRPKFNDFSAVGRAAFSLILGKVAKFWAGS